MTEEDKWLNKVVKKSGDAIENSSIYLSMFNKDFREDPKCALEMGIAVLLDKPIAVLAYDDTIIPENIKKMAVAIEFVNEGDMESTNLAVKRLIDKCMLEVKKNER